MVMAVCGRTGDRWTVCNRWEHEAQLRKVRRVNGLTAAKERGGRGRVIQEVQVCCGGSSGITLETHQVLA